jgi:hypothetical protein
MPLRVVLRHDRSPHHPAFGVHVRWFHPVQRQAFIVPTIGWLILILSGLPPDIGHESDVGLRENKAEFSISKENRSHASFS